MNFEILLSDPPWHYTDKATAGERGAAFKYPVMSVDDICALDVQAHMARAVGNRCIQLEQVA